ncbi:protein SGT1 homolog [Neocloeon triangulifer]|uniref:protein SGT1 homolog n=1 Tax=Neocloeon triangulifer TaxID=2078957 RepID=UPI00286F3E26|nr:protein SGT1 homolog [Neocloeon triangulifer]
MTEEATAPVVTAPAVRIDWYQTETHVTVEAMAKKVDPEKSVIQISSQTVTIDAKLSNGDEYKKDIHLSFEIIPDQSSYKIMSTKIELKLKKRDGIRWEKLEGDETSRPMPAHPEASGGSSGPPKYPSSSKAAKDWDKITIEDEKEDGIDQLFQKIYAEGSDEIRKAMNKSFTESNGTVLSTNWKEIAGGKVEMKAPDGQEFKKWE